MWSILLLLNGLRGLGSLQTESGKLPVQVTVPEKIRSNTSGGYESEVSYRITITDKTYTMNLVQKAFLPPNFRVYTYDSAGILKSLEQQFQNFCYFQGYIEGYPDSMVIVNTCTGLRGFLQFGNVSYGIEPLESSIGFEHVIYQVKHKKIDALLYTEKDMDLRDLQYKIQTIELKPDFFHYIEMHLVVEKELYDRMGTDISVVTQKIFQLIGLVNAIFAPLNLTVILSSLEFWIDENRISVTGDANELLYKFLKWKHSYLVLRPHDIAFLLVYREVSDYVGATFQGKMCDKTHAGGIALHPKTITLESLSIILVQLLSLSMGIAYDDLSKCQCGGAICIMNPEAIYSSGMKTFSNCSIEKFTSFISSQSSYCLLNQPRLQLSYKKAVCGNGKLETGEVCDCGTEGCGNNPPPCCDPATCQLSQGSVCADGPCCDNCNVMKKGSVCRPANEECDLVEYCNGSAAVCDEDFFVHNGHPCGDNQWICINGSCQSGSKQCADTFGEDADFGTNECYNELNSKNDISGNCGITADGYIACSPKNLKCGKLICKYKSDKLIKVKSATTIYANISGHICVSLEYAYDHGESHKMWVRDGTVCDSKKVCLNKECVQDTFLNYDCTPETCNNHGVCNNKKHCHCDHSYLPPACDKTDDLWPGGSVDSGNQRAESAPIRSYVETAYSAKPTRWPYFLIIPFYIIICVLVGILVRIHTQRRKWRTEEYSSDDQFESESESKT
uniref:Disintegrin and metalloproteinase domain-containing protein 2 n=1 Tax=Nannospalax galili TaxID=1026970 RepID=A0A8C6QHZ1_NANGA